MRDNGDVSWLHKREGCPWEAQLQSLQGTEGQWTVLAQARDDAAAGQSVVLIPDATAGKDAVMDAAARNVFVQMDSDRKTTALKSLQVCP